MYAAICLWKFGAKSHTSPLLLHRKYPLEDLILYLVYRPDPIALKMRKLLNRDGSYNFVSALIISYTRSCLCGVTIKTRPLVLMSGRGLYLCQLVTPRGPEMQKAVNVVSKENKHCEFVYGSSELNLLHLPFFRNGKDPLEDFDYSDPRCNPFQQPNRL
ncbi:hypothetical protein F511_16031 [Dorcoceras hygrometricum]|uniref:Uncharacterized protein n=1 Tax=Dorcoceras hygrometricum TaxID=472368 RepID=A0A2Z7BVE0_9LAMI|nr:hypothetical protein F511_16031 [Dorcoceras hygrometricum]